MSLSWLTVAMAVVCVGCAEIPSADGPVLPSGVTYEFVWSGAGVVSEGAGDWSVTSNLGYEVRVSRGVLTLSTVQLVPCDDTTASVPEPWVVRVTDWLLGVRHARAGHGATVTDPSAALGEVLEVVEPSASVTLGPAELASHDFCGLHVLFGPSVATPSPGQVDMYLHLLHLEGTWSRGEGEAETFMVHTALPTGALVDLEEADGSALRIRSGTWAAKVRIEPDLGGLFKDVDFETASEELRDKTILTSLVDGLEARVMVLQIEEPAT